RDPQGQERACAADERAGNDERDGVHAAVWVCAVLPSERSGGGSGLGDDGGAGCAGGGGRGIGSGTGGGTTKGLRGGGAAGGGGGDGKDVESGGVAAGSAGRAVSPYRCRDAGELGDVHAV